MEERILLREAHQVLCSLLPGLRVVVESGGIVQVEVFVQGIAEFNGIFDCLAAPLDAFLIYQS